MLNIKKSTETQEFKDFKREQSKVCDLSDYDGKYNELITSEAKNAAQKSLCEDQGYLCCYCMQRINHVRCPDDKVQDVKCMRLEHFKCQSNHKELKFEFSNMLAACHGFNHRRDSEKHCDVSKADAELKYDPSSYDVERIVFYLPDGTIYSNDTEFSEQLDNVLNLNIEYLKRNRKSVRDGVKKYLDITGWKEGNYKKALAKYETQNSDGELKEYCGVAINYLKKKLHQPK
ncbi:hypothetical protein [Maridesulfovibrio sp.]|uniref:hypothetical protein n=1 Tax=unclassified Maridesulfovibrio TaxID=2794999 RepID=UPI003B008910